MTRIAPTRRTGSGSRRLGYLLAVLINAATLYVINVWPGWQAVPFLTGDTLLVLGLVNLSLVAGIIANLVNLVLDFAPVKALGDLVILGIGLAVLVRVWDVFPFDFQGSTFDWTLLVRVVLGVAFFGTIIGILVQIVVLVRSILGRSTHE